MSRSKPSPVVAMITLFVVVAVSVLLSSCAASKTEPAPQPVPAEDGSAPDPPVSSSMIAPGLTDMPDGTVQAVGKLEHSDLEGGFWKITDSTRSEGSADAAVVVIANGDDLAADLEPLKGKHVMAVGKRQDGVSTRMAGPEMVADKVEEFSDMVDGAAE